MRSSFKKTLILFLVTIPICFLWAFFILPAGNDTFTLITLLIILTVSLGLSKFFYLEEVVKITTQDPIETRKDLQFIHTYYLPQILMGTGSFLLLYYGFSQNKEWYTYGGVAGIFFVIYGVFWGRNRMLKWVESEKSLKHSRLNQFIFIGCVMFLVLGSIFFKYKNNIMPPTQFETNSKQIAEWRGDGTETFKLLRDEEVGFEIKHPNWIEDFVSVQGQIIGLRLKDPNSNKNTSAVVNEIYFSFTEQDLCVPHDWRKGSGLIEYKKVCFFERPVTAVLTATDYTSKQLETMITGTFKFIDKVVFDTQGYVFDHPSFFEFDLESSKMIVGVEIAKDFLPVDLTMGVGVSLNMKNDTGSLGMSMGYDEVEKKWLVDLKKSERFSVPNFITAESSVSESEYIKSIIGRYGATISVNRKGHGTLITESDPFEILITNSKGD